MANDKKNDQQFNVKLPAELCLKVKHKAVADGCSNGEIVRIALEQYFKGKKVPGGA